MKKVLIIIAALFLSVGAFASEVEKKGFLTTKWCADRGMFADCRIESVFCGYEECWRDQKEFSAKINGKIVLYVHDEGKSYEVDFGHKIHLGEVLEKAINRNEVTVIGSLHGDKIHANGFKAPPPPKKSFFKGCL